jgi:hypothetical protein
VDQREGAAESPRDKSTAAPNKSGVPEKLLSILLIEGDGSPEQDPGGDARGSGSIVAVSTKQDIYK